VAFAGFAMEGTERNPDFLDEVAAAVRSSASQGAAAKKKGGLFSGFAKGPAQPKILVMCQTGGSLETSDERIAKGESQRALWAWMLGAAGDAHPSRL
jgi:hypothetical protein